MTQPMALTFNFSLPSASSYLSTFPINQVEGGEIKNENAIATTKKHPA